MTGDHLRSKKLSRRKCVAAGAVGTLGLVAGCLGSDDDTPEGMIFQGDATVTHWPDLMYNAPYHVTIQNGYFDDHDIDVEFVGSEGGGTTVRNVVDGGIPFGEVATPAAINAYISGAPLEVVAGATQATNEIVGVSPVGSDVESLDDLDGGTIGFTSAGSVSETTARLVIDVADEIDDADVEFQEMGGLGEALTGAQEGAVDVATHTDPVYSQQQVENDEPWQPVFWAADHVQRYQQTCIIVDPSIIEDNPEAVEAYIAARAQGVEFLIDNPDEAAEMYSEGTEGFSTEVLRNAIDNIDPAEHYSTGAYDVNGLRNVQNAMIQTGLLDEDQEVPWEDIFSQSFIDENDHIDFVEI